MTEQKIDQLLLGKSLVFLFSANKAEKREAFIELNWWAPCLREEGGKDPLFASSCSLQVSADLLLLEKPANCFFWAFFLPIYTGFLYVCMYGWARALRGEAKSSSNKRSTCSVTTWSSVISAGSPPFCSSFLRAYALSQQHIFLAVVAFFQNFWKQGL